MASVQQIRQRNNVTVSAGQGPCMAFSHGFGYAQPMWRLVAASCRIDPQIGDHCSQLGPPAKSVALIREYLAQC